MGKPTGFLEYERTEARSVEPKERIKNFNEFHIFLSKEKQQEQAARCMDCGVPFCQSGSTIAGMTSGCPSCFIHPFDGDFLLNSAMMPVFDCLMAFFIEGTYPPSISSTCL